MPTVWTREDRRVLVGRAIETEALTTLLGHQRLVTLVGPGGVGKTTLARHVLSKVSGLDRSNSFIDVTELPPAGLLAEVAEASGFGSFDRLVDARAEHAWLLVLDNCEHMLDPVAAAIETMLEKLHRIRILATSREPIEVTEETIVRLAPLSLDGAPSPAVQLFLQRSRSARKNLEAKIDVVAQICRAVDGLPLAIELAAAKTSSMTPNEILAALDNPIELLDHPRRRTPARHASVRAAISWSYQLLEEPERRALARLAVFEGAFTPNMADAALGFSSRDLLGSLVDRSLLVHEVEGNESWYRMLETVRAFGREILEDTGQAEETRRSVNKALLAELETLTFAPTRIPMMIKRGFPTVRRAFEDLLVSSNDVERVFGLMAHLWWLEDVGHQSEGARIVEEAIGRWPEPNPHSAIGYGVLSGFQRFAGDLDGAETSARIAIEASHGIGAAFGFRLLGQEARRSGDWQKALDHFEQGTATARRDGFEGFALEIRIHTAMTLARSGDMSRAFEVIEEVVTEADPYPLLEQWARLFQSWISFGKDLDAAARISREVLENAASEEDPWVTAVAHQHLGLHSLLIGDEPEGAAHLLSSLKKFHEIANRSDISLTLLAIAAMLNRSGDADNARRVMASVNELGTHATLGTFEASMFKDIGPLPEGVHGVQSLSAPELIRLLETTVSTSAPLVTAADTFTQVGDMWRVVFDGQEALLADSKGMSDLAILLSQPGVEVSSLDLVGSAVAPSDAGPVSDEHALQDYRRRLAELREEIDEAESANDPHRADRAREESEQLLEHISGAYGLAGRSRPDRDPAEKARSAVTARIRSTIKRIRKAHQPLADHLDRSVRTGRYCTYEPAETRIWEL